MARGGRRRTTGEPTRQGDVRPSTSSDASRRRRAAPTQAPVSPATLRGPERDDEPPAWMAQRVVIEDVQPQVDGGRFAPKRVAGDLVEVRASIFADGHEQIVAVLRDRAAGSLDGPWRESRMVQPVTGVDSWVGRFEAASVGWHEFAITAWVDPFATWRHALWLRASAGVDVLLDLVDGARLVRDAAARARQVGSEGDAATWLEAQAQLLGDAERATVERVAAAQGERLRSLMFTYADRRHATTHRTLRVWVDRERARTGAWYEMFPRSEGPAPGRGATLGEAARRLPYIASLGFDVVYLPPVHPIGTTHRKGPNNSLEAGPDDPGSPWAIGSPAGGHDAIDPGLGTLDDFDTFVREAGRLGLEVALDLAWQCSPDHPWVFAHPEWFRHRADGSIRYAENPPKQYQDIYPLDFACDDWRSLWRALFDVTASWVTRGIRIFRVDNPHTKSFGFWEWLIARVHEQWPDVVFLAEAFTRPAPMYYLAKAGFSQSYTYFTWRNTRPELEAYLTELTTAGVVDYFRPNFFANTPDILHEYLQTGGCAAFEARVVLAATLSASYGLYSGFELCERTPVREGSEEYLDSEKYQLRWRDRTQPAPLAWLITALNRIRREHPAFRRNDTLRFCACDNPRLIAYAKWVSTSHGQSADVLLTVVNLDPHAMQHGHVEVPLDLIGASPESAYPAVDLLTDTPFDWRGAWNYVRFDPGVRQAHVLQLGTPRPDSPHHP